MAKFNTDKIKRVAKILRENAEYQARQRVMQHMKQPKATELPERESLESEMVKDAPAEKHGQRLMPLATGVLHPHRYGCRPYGR